MTINANQYLYILRYKLIQQKENEDFLQFPYGAKCDQPHAVDAEMSTFFSSQTVDRFKIYTLLQPMQNVPYVATQSPQLCI